MIVFLDGQFVPEAEAVVSVFDRCFLYGDGLFETFRLYQGEPFRWIQHFKRLQGGARGLNIHIPLSAKTILRAAKELWRRNGSPVHSVIRLTLSRGVGPRGYSPADAKKPRLIMTLDPSAPRNPGKNFKIITSSIAVSATDPLSKHKTCNKLHQILARAEADQAGAQEALMINTKGFVAEATSSNLFWISEGIACAPPLYSGGLPGITRSVVFEIMLQLGISAAEREITPRKLLNAEGIFLSVSTQELIEVTELDGNPLPRSELVAKLQAAYKTLVNKELGLS